MSNADPTKRMAELAGRRPTAADIEILRGACNSKVLVRQSCLDGIPHAFRDRWEHWERIRDITRETLGIEPHCVRITGSANHGWSWARKTEWDKSRSDLDLFLISPHHFDVISEAISELLGSSPPARRPGLESGRAIKILRQQHGRGFVSLWHVKPKRPVIAPFTRCQTLISNYAYKHGLIPRDDPKNLSKMRLYRDFAAAERQLIRNFEGLHGGRSS